jgi:hypothetical protein
LEARHHPHQYNCPVAALPGAGNPMPLDCAATNAALLGSQIDAMAPTTLIAAAT